MVKDVGDVNLRRRDFCFALQKTGRLTQIPHGDYAEAGNYRRFGGVFGRHQHARLAFLTGTQGDGQDAFDRADRAIERQFAHHDKILELIGFDLFAGGGHPDGNGQVKAWSLLLHVGRGEIDRRAAKAEVESGIDEGRHHAVSGLFDRRVGKADDDDDRVAVTGIDLHFDGIGFDAVDSGGTDFG